MSDDDDDLLDDNDDFDSDIDDDDYEVRLEHPNRQSALRRRARTRRHPENWDDDWQDPEDDLMYGFNDEEE